MSKIDLREYANADKKLIKKLAGRKAFDPCLDTPVSIEKVRNTCPTVVQTIKRRLCSVRR